jgi:hypothetical protein
MAKNQPPEGLFFRDVEFNAHDSFASLQPGDFQARVTINDNAG